MTLIINIITLVACISAMTYCYVLSKRIRAFDNVKDGIGALIEEMIRTTNELQSTFSSTQRNVDAQNNRLQDKIDEGIAMSEYINTLIDDAQTTLEDVRNIKKDLSPQLHTPITPHIDVPERHHTPIMPTPSTLPKAFQIQDNTEIPDDVIPSDFEQFKRYKKRQQSMRPKDTYGEEYL